MEGFCMHQRQGAVYKYTPCPRVLVETVVYVSLDYVEQGALFFR
jgi:hypothetical protein